MRVLFVGGWDNANVGYAMWQAALAAGIEADGYVGQRHPFDYPKQLPRIPCDPWELPGYQDYDIVHIINGADGRLTQKIHDSYRGKIVCQYGDNNYRRSWGSWPHLADFNIIETADLLGHSEHEILMVPPVDVEYLRPPERTSSQLYVSHFPSSSDSKGSPTITREIVIACEASGSKAIAAYEWEKKPIPWSDHIKRVASCDIYVETLKPILGDQICGEPGVSSREAAALGCVVVTNSLRVHCYEREYGPTGLQIANTPCELRMALRRLLDLPIDDLRALQQATRDWVVRNHSYKVTGERLIERVYAPLLESK